VFESDYTDYPPYNTPFGTPIKGASAIRKPGGSVRKPGASVKEEGELSRMDTIPQPKLLFKDD